MNPIRRILQRRLHILNPSRRNQLIKPRVLRRNLRNHAVDLLGILHIDVSVAERAFESVCHSPLRLIEGGCRLLLDVEAVDFATGLDEGLRECKAEALGASGDDVDTAVELGYLSAC